ncbi:MAG: glycoside hydrolase family 55 protein, partial [Planctomycetota bacterium]|nr:glycoside hydrolase family 55 protein [Planctomycetota bacterium]
MPRTILTLLVVTSMTLVNQVAAAVLGGVPASQASQATPQRRWQRLALSARLSMSVIALVLATCLTGTLQAAETTPIRFPADAGLVDVTTYGAKGDGKTDDTAAITKAIGDHVGHSATIYFPPGTYLVSDRLDWRSKEGTARCWLAFQGAGPEHSIIRLKDATFTDPKNPKGVVRTNSEFQGWNGDKPEQNQIGYGNKAFFNSLRDLTIDVGVGNPGAIGIEYMANNRGTLRNLVIRSSDPQGAGDCGIDMRRYGPGPALCVDVVIEGFAIGMDLAHWEYGMTFDNLTLRHQTQVGIRNNNHSLAIENLVYEGSASVYQALEGNGLLTVLNATITGKGSATDKPAFNNQGGLYLRNATATGFRCLVRHNEQDVPGLSAKLYTSSQPVVRGNGPANGLQ